MPEFFKWKPQREYEIDETPDVAVVSLGDSYEQRQTKGINPLMPSYSLTFSGVGGVCGRANPVDEIRAFLKARMAVESFLWIPSDTGVPGLYVCRSWKVTKTGPHKKLTTTFEQVPR